MTECCVCAQKVPQINENNHGGTVLIKSHTTGSQNLGAYVED